MCQWIYVAILAMLIITTISIIIEDHIAIMTTTVTAQVVAITITEIITAVAVQEVAPTVARMVVTIEETIGVEGRW